MTNYTEAQLKAMPAKTRAEILDELLENQLKEFRDKVVELANSMANAILAELDEQAKGDE